eukprot:5604756-Pyramimonas_sp.AAC.1
MPQPPPNLGTAGEPELHARCQPHNQLLEFCKAAQQMHAAIDRDDEDTSDAASDLGAGRPAELQQLN